MQAFDTDGDAGNEHHDAEHAVERLDNKVLIGDVIEDGHDDIDRGKNQSRDPKFGAVHPAAEVEEQMAPTHCLPRSVQQSVESIPPGAWVKASSGIHRQFTVDQSRSSSLMLV